MVMKLGIFSAFLICLLASAAESEVDDDLSASEAPFRMQKLNVYWDKARIHQVKDPAKLRSLFEELKIHEKEEFDLKRLKADKMDKDGLREAQVRKRFRGILNKYGLLNSLNDSNDYSNSKKKAEHRKEVPTFKDAKLNKLWEKAVLMDLDPEELHLLKQEFKHHQEKVDEYHGILEELRVKNSLLDNGDKKGLDKKKRDIKLGYDRLHKLATNKIHNRVEDEFDDFKFKDPHVQGLWKMAQEGDFTVDELESIREELSHYEKRLEKLKLLKAELNLVDERHHHSEKQHEKSEGRKIMDMNIRKHSETIERLHQDLTDKISSRILHSEL